MKNIIINSIKKTDDEAVYAYLTVTRLEGNVMLSDEGEADLLNHLRTKALKDEI